MGAWPVKRLEAIVSFLIPPECRESVAGDLRERNLSDGDYFVEAVATIPMVVWSRIRRTTDPRVLLLEGLVLYACFLFFARGAGNFLLEEWAFVRLAVPVIVALWVLVLVDAYAAGPKRSPLYPIRDAVLGLMAAGLTWSVPVKVMLMGGGMSVLLVSALRMLFPPDENRPRGAT
jgi:hypothetical protein